MPNPHEQLLGAIAAEAFDEAMRLVSRGLNLNAACDNGASVLFAAILSGDVPLVRLMLEHGANPNFHAEEPAATIYTEKPLDLAMQARFLLSWEKYHPIVQLLEQYDATDLEGRIESMDERQFRELRAMERQVQ